ncbi:MAG: VIT domain-containing protein [Kofleriaceae bacterium]
MTESKDVLEHNVRGLIESGGESPRMAAAARGRIREQLVAKFAAPAVADRTDSSTLPAQARRARVPRFALGAGLVATAAVAAIALHFAGGHGAGVAAIGDGAHTLADGTTYIARPGATVAVLGPREVRVTGAVLLDVVPGKGTFVVDTARGRIEVLGTRFVVDGAPDQTSAAVVRGEVKLASASGEVVLHAGEQGIAIPGQAPIRGPAPRLSHLVSWAQQARHAEEHALPVHHGTLFARDPGVRSHPPWGEEYPLPIKQLTVDVTVEDQVARVALDQTFHNNAAQDLEGVYRFAIPPDAALQRLAMYVDGKLTESAVVERMRARRIYEELVYRRVDPALLEWAGTGRLALRVYPVKAHEDKRLMLAYTQSLPKLYDDYTLTVPLPEVDEAVGAFDVAVRLKGCGNCELASTSHSITTERSGDDAIVKVHREHAAMGDSFVLHVRDTRQRSTVATARDGGDTFMLVRAPVALDANPAPYKPRTWIVLDDVSASRGTPELRAQRDLIEAFLKELDENDKIGVIAFDVAARTKLAPTRVMDVDHAALRQALAHEGGVGATDFGVALQAATAQLAGVDPDSAMIVYLGDGLITSGTSSGTQAGLDGLRAELADKAHFIGVGVGDGPDTQTLGALAAATGGYATTFDLSDDLGWRAFDLVAALHTARVTGLEAKLVDATGELVPATAYLGSPQLAEGEQLELVAKLASDKTASAVQLTGTLAGAPWQQTIQLGAARPHAGYLPRLWAQRHIAARLLAKHEPVVLAPCMQTRGNAPCPTEAEAREARDEQIRREVVALGKKYFLLSRHTSLLVLENDAMYAQYGVTKGAGDTWAPYALPATIPVVRTPTPTPTLAIADDAELVRAPLQVFYDFGGLYDQQQRATQMFARDLQGDDAVPSIGATLDTRGVDRAVLDRTVGGELAKAKDKTTTRTTADTASMAEAKPSGEATPLDAVTTGPMALDEGKAGKDDLDFKQLDDAALEGGLVASIGHGAGTGQGFGIGSGRGGGDWSAGWYGPQSFTTLFASPSAPQLHDLTGFVPALFDDAADRLRRGLGKPLPGAGGQLSDAARALLTKARALPSGVYRWGDRELAVDAAHRFGWRRTTGDNLAETAVYDGATWMRRYAELGLEVVRPIAADDLALGLAYLPIWIADPMHYARYFDVTANGREVTLATHGKPVYVLAFDAQARLVAVRDGAGTTLLEIAWGLSGPMAAKLGGEAITVGFTPEPIADAGAWAHGSTAAGVTVELPGHTMDYWRTQVAAQQVGSPAWRRAERQSIVASAAQHDPASAYDAFVQLRDHGGVELGDLVLASAGLVQGANDELVTKLLASFPDQPVAAYIATQRAYSKHPVPSALHGATGTGLVGALAQLRLVDAQLAVRDANGAAATLDAMPAAATELRLAAASAAAQHWDLPLAPLLHMWDAVAVGPAQNVVRMQAAALAYSRGDYELAAQRIARLVEQLDLDAAPAQLANAQYYFTQSRRGTAGWELVYAQWRAKVLAGSSYDHAMALLPAAHQHQDSLPVLARAAELAGDATERQVELARMALTYGQTGWARARVQALVARSPSREVYQLAAQIAQSTGDLAEALTDLERAQDLGGGGRVGLATLRAELAQILTVAQQLAQQTLGAERDRVVQRALHWGERWRAVDPGNPQIDRMLGDLLLAVGDEAGAWRQLSTVIERDPWSGTGYMTVAETFERRGKVADSLPYWQQAIVIDQTNPTPRLRKAQALIALGRADDGERLLHDITSQTWHDVWSGVVYQAQALERRPK